MNILAWIFVVVCAAVIFKIYWIYTIKWNGSYTCLVGKTAIVTGANTGLGYVTALDFAKRGARVVLACRNKERAEAAADRIVRTTGNKNIVYKIVDMASLRSVRKFAEDINQNEERLDILVNNASTVFGDTDYTEDGIQTVLQANHISAFLLVHLLIEKMKKCAPSRIVNVGSLAGRFADLTLDTFEKLNEIPKPDFRLLSDYMMYRNSKLCNILFTTELAKKIKDTGVTVNTLHPGSINSELFRDVYGLLKLYNMIIGTLYFLTTEEGAQTQIYLSVSKDVEGVSGKIYTNRTQHEIYPNAKNPELARKLWQASEEMARLSASEKL